MQSRARMRMRTLAAAMTMAVGSASAEELSESEMVKVEPVPGVETVSPMKPTWCGSVKPKGRGRTGGALNRSMKEYARGSLTSLPSVARLLCESPDEPTFQQQTAWFVQQLVNDIHVTAAEAV